MAIETANIGKVIVETKIRGTTAKVWEALTQEIHRWWPAEFYMGGEAGNRRYVLEARPGGRMFEEWSDGGGLLWGTVLSAVPEKRLDVFGVATPEWGGPSMWTGTWDLSTEGDGTRLRFTEASVGVVSDESLGDKKSGWNFLFGSVLPAHVEGREPPAWENPTD